MWVRQIDIQFIGLYVFCCTASVLLAFILSMYIMYGSDRYLRISRLLIKRRLFRVR